MTDCSLLLEAAVDDHLVVVNGGRVAGHGRRPDLGGRVDLGPPGVADVVRVKLVEQTPPVQRVHRRVAPPAKQQQGVLVPET